jgi:hypothetical protein
MTRYVIGPDVAIGLAHDKAVISADHQILAPALLRSQLRSIRTWPIGNDAAFIAQMDQATPAP